MIEKRSKECAHCGLEVREAMLHYLLDCPNTAPLRTGGPETTGLDRSEGAARLVVHIVDNMDELKDILMSLPPPR